MSKTISQLRAEKAARVASQKLFDDLLEAHTEILEAHEKKLEQEVKRRISESANISGQNTYTKASVELFLGRLHEWFPTIKLSDGWKSMIKDELIREWVRVQEEIENKYGVKESGIDERHLSMEARQASGTDHAEHAQAPKPKKQVSEATLAALAAGRAKAAAARAEKIAKWKSGI